MILILSNKFDIAVDYVIRLLRKRGIRFFRLNTEDLIYKNSLVTLPDFSFKIEKEGSKWELSRIKSIWFRRPGKPFEFDSRDKRPQVSVLSFVEDQWHAFIEGLKSIDSVFWMNDPDNNHNGENKILQLKLAHSVGLRIPRTCITNDKDTAVRFRKKCGDAIVAKALSLPLIEEEERDFFIFTNIIKSIEDIPEQEFCMAPTIFQELLNNKTDYRLTIVGDKCFSVKVVRESSERIQTDWRLVKHGIRFIPCEIPSDVSDKCFKLVKRLGLVFGAIDIVQTADGFYFLEINPNGEWAWLQKEARLPIAEALVDELYRGD